MLIQHQWGHQSTTVCANQIWISWNIVCFHIWRKKNLRKEDTKDSKLYCIYFLKIWVEQRTIREGCPIVAYIVHCMCPLIEQLMTTRVCQDYLQQIEQHLSRHLGISTCFLVVKTHDTKVTLSNTAMGNLYI